MGLQIRIIALFILGTFAQLISGQSAHREWRAADELFDEEAYSLAEKKYRSAAGKKEDPALHYNWGNTLYEQEAYADAITQYEKSLSMADIGEDLRFKVHHNKGNAHARQGEWEKAISNYREALKLNPKHNPTRENLWRAMQQIPPPQQQSQKSEESDPSEKDKEESQEEQQSKAKDKENQSDSDQTEAPQAQPDRPLSEEELERLMQAVEREDARVQEDRRRKSSGKARPLKDW